MKIKISFSSKKLANFLRKYSHRLIYLIIFVYFSYLVFFLYQYGYLSLMEKKAIDPTLVARKKEILNQVLFEKVKKELEEKTNPPTNSNPEIKNPF